MQLISRKGNIRWSALNLLKAGLVVTSSVFDCGAEPVTLRNPAATFSQVSGWNANLIVDGITNDSAGWAVYDFGRSGAFSETAVVETETDVGFASGSLLTFALYHVNHNPQSGLGCFRLSYTTDARDAFADGLNSGGDVTANWVVLPPTTASATDGVVLTIQPDGSILASGDNPAKTVYTVTAEVAAQGITGFRLEALEDPSLPNSGPGRSPNGNFVLTEMTADIIQRTPSPNVVLKNPTATFSQIAGWNANLITDGVTNDFAGWAVYDFGRGGAFAETAVVETETDIGFASGSLLTFALYHVNHNPQHGLGRFRLSYTKDSRDTFADGLNSSGDVTANWIVLTPKTASATDGVILTIQPDGSILASGDNPTKTVYTVTTEVSAQGITGFRIEALEDPSLPASGPGRYPSNGNFVLTEFTANIVQISLPPVLPVDVVLKNAAATFSQVSGWNASLIIDGITNDSAGWAVYDFGRVGAFAETAVVETETDIGFASGSLLTFALYHVNHNPQSGLGRFRLSYTTDPRDTFADGLNSGGDVTANWVVLTPRTASATDGVVLTIQSDGSILASGDNPAKTVYTVTANVAARGITGFRIEALEDPSLPDSGPGRSPNGNFVLTELAVTVSALPPTEPPLPRTDYILSRDFSPTNNPNGVWSFGAKPSLGGAFALFGIHGLNPFEYWQLIPSQEPTIYRNGTSNTITVGEQGVFPPGSVFLFSGTDGASNVFGVVRFTVPAGGSSNYVVHAEVAPVYDGSIQGDTDFHVVRNGAELFGRFLAPADRSGYSNIVLLTAGDTVDFMVGRGQDNSGLASGLKIKVTITPTDTPSSSPCAPSASGLVGWWSFEDDADDLTGNHHGTLSGSPVFSSGKVGQGLRFDGANDLVRIAAAPGLNVGAGAGFSIEGWINPTDLSHLRPIAEWNGNSGVGGIGTLFWTGVQVLNPGDGDRNLTANLIDTTGTPHGIHTPPGLVTTGVWQHVALTYDKTSGQATIYYNGASAAQANLGSFTPLTTGDLYFGNRPSGPFSAIYWSGGMDEMSLYNRALSAADIAVIHAAGAVGKCATLPPQPTNCPVPAGLVSWWRGESNAEDSVSSNDGELRNGATFAAGMVGQGFRLNGLGSYVRIPHNPSLNFDSQITVELWYKYEGADVAYGLVAKRGTETGPVNFGISVIPIGLGLYFNDPSVANGDDADHGGTFEASRYLPVPASGVFHHLATTCRQASPTEVEVKTYLNGQLVKTKTIAASLARTLSEAPITVGRSAEYGGEFFEGIIDEVSIYNRALAATEVQAIHQAGSAGKCVPTNQPPLNHSPVAVISSEQLIELESEYDNPVLLSCNWWNSCLVADGWTSSDPEGGELTYMWSLEDDPVPFAVGPVVTNCLEVGQHTILLTVTDPAGLQGTDRKTIEVVTTPLAIDLLIEEITESHKSGVLLSRKTKRELIGTLQVALEHAGDGELRATQKALDAFEKKVRAQVANEYPEAATAWIRWSQAVSEGMENCINPPRKDKDHHGDRKDADSGDTKG